MGCWVVLDHGEKREILEMHDKIDRYRSSSNQKKRHARPKKVSARRVHACKQISAQDEICPFLSRPDGFPQRVRFPCAKYPGLGS